MVLVSFQVKLALCEVEKRQTIVMVKCERAVGVILEVMIGIIILMKLYFLLVVDLHGSI